MLVKYHSNSKAKLNKSMLRLALRIQRSDVRRSTWLAIDLCSGGDIWIRFAGAWRPVPGLPTRRHFDVPRTRTPHGLASQDMTPRVTERQTNHHTIFGFAQYQTKMHTNTMRGYPGSEGATHSQDRGTTLHTAGSRITSSKQTNPLWTDPRELGNMPTLGHPQA